MPGSRTSAVLEEPAELQRSDLFDYSLGYDEDISVRFAAHLSSAEREEASLLYQLFTPPNEAVGLWGLCVVVGAPGNGKDTFGNILTYKLKRFFPHKRTLRDERPRPLYGEYAGLFNEAVIQDDLTKMREVAKGGGIADYNAALEKAADKWVTEQGEVLLKHSVLYLTEFWRYCYNREPHNPMNKTMGGIHKQKRHLDTLVVGTAQQVSDLDRFTCLPWVDWQVTCVKSVANITGFVYYVDRVRWDKRRRVLVPLNPVSQTFPIAWDAGKPRVDLGEGRVTLRRPRYRPETEEEGIVLTVIKDIAEGGNAVTARITDVVDYIEEHGDMSEEEVLETIKLLRFAKDATGQPKRVVTFPCFFDLFNSKSAPQMRSSLKIKD